MNPADQYTPDTTPRGNSSGELTAMALLLRREFAAITKMREVMDKMIAEEERLGVDICTGMFIDCEWALRSAKTALVREMQRVNVRLDLDLSEGAAVPSQH